MIIFKSATVQDDGAVTINVEDTGPLVVKFGSSASGVQSYNNRTGAVIPVSTDITTALGYTPYKSDASQAIVDFVVSGNSSGGYMITVTLGSVSRSYTFSSTTIAESLMYFVISVARTISNAGLTWYSYTPIIQSNAATSGILRFESVTRGYKSILPTISITNTGGSTVTAVTRIVSAGGTP